jgi:hypothetical protein
MNAMNIGRDAKAVKSRIPTLDANDPAEAS